jgi:tRNA (guanine37-N1)-methyltransferase
VTEDRGAPWRCTVLTAFPRWLEAPFGEGVLGRARAAGRIDLRLVDLRPYGVGRHRSLDAPPFGGGAGMLYMAGPVLSALDEWAPEGSTVALLSPDGEPLTQPVAAALAELAHLVVVCPRYEGIDERVRSRVQRVLSVGDVVLMGAEPAAWVLVEAVARLVPGVVEAHSLGEESFATGLLEGPQYTRPREVAGLAVPQVLVSGDHAAVARFARREAWRRTLRQRPDLAVRAPLRPGDAALLGEILTDLGRS